MGELAFGITMYFFGLGVGMLGLACLVLALFAFYKLAKRIFK